MQDEIFEWDDQKDINWRCHGISFDMAREVFNDCFGVVCTDARHDDNEERFALLGMVDERLLFVAYTHRGERIRIISARKAEPHERRRYHNQNREI